ncbi:MAG: hemerythrin domain-containing protein [Candidatus Limnocylindrales bacterium]
MHTLPKTSHAHHDRLLHEVDRMPAVGDMIGRAPIDELRTSVDGMAASLTDLLIPHMEAQEAALYPEFERILQNRHSMAPMRREHVEIRDLVARIETVRHRLADGHLGTGEGLELRRAIFRLYALLKVHLAEEELYVSILDHSVEEERGDQLAVALRHVGAAEL